jgi:hypothetical protein
MNGLGPLTSKLIDDYKNKPMMELKSATGQNILNNIFQFIHNDMYIEDDSNFIYHFQEEEIFNKMINSFLIIKRNSILFQWTQERYRCSRECSCKPFKQCLC